MTVLHPCPWCLALHDGMYLLCDEHEALARKKKGMPPETSA